MKKSLPSLQAFRGFAALLVVFFHGFSDDGKTGFFSFGYAGVDFFFVLSGFIIYYVHQDDLGNRQRLVPFIKKRFVRIYPIYFFALTIRCLLMLTSYSVKDAAGLTDVLKALFLIPVPFPPGPLVSVSWTLSHEVFFYGLFALAIVMPKASARLLFGLWVVALLGAFLFLDPSKAPFWQRFVLNVHNLEFAMGIAAAVLIPHRETSFGGLAQALGILLFATTAVVSSHTGAGTTHRYDLAYGIGSAVLIWGLAVADLRRPPNWPAIFLFLGNASYSIYLVHATILFNALRIAAKISLGSPLAELGLKIAATVIAVAAGCLVHVLVEKPILRGFRKSKP